MIWRNGNFLLLFEKDFVITLPVFNLLKKPGKKNWLKEGTASGGDPPLSFGMAGRCDCMDVFFFLLPSPRCLLSGTLSLHMQDTFGGVVPRRMPGNISLSLFLNPWSLLTKHNCMIFPRGLNWGWWGSKPIPIGTQFPNGFVLPYQTQAWTDSYEPVFQSWLKPHTPTPHRKERQSISNIHMSYQEPQVCLKMRISMCSIYIHFRDKPFMGK